MYSRYVEAGAYLRMFFFCRSILSYFFFQEKKLYECSFFSLYVHVPGISLLAPEINGSKKYNKSAIKVQSMNEWELHQLAFYFQRENWLEILRCGKTPSIPHHRIIIIPNSKEIRYCDFKVQSWHKYSSYVTINMHVPESIQVQVFASTIKSNSRFQFTVACMLHCMTNNENT